MTLWIDGDACPADVKRVVFRAAERLGIALRLVANQEVAVPRSVLIRTIRVGRGLDEADRYIAERSQAGDLVITADIPLAAELVAKQVAVVSPRGETFTESNVADRLAMRDLLQQLRDDGHVGGGPPPFGDADLRRFASAFDRLVTRLHASAGKGRTKQNGEA